MSHVKHNTILSLSCSKHGPIHQYFFSCRIEGLIIPYAGLSHLELIDTPVSSMLWAAEHPDRWSMCPSKTESKAKWSAGTMPQRVLSYVCSVFQSCILYSAKYVKLFLKFFWTGELFLLMQKGTDAELVQQGKSYTICYEKTFVIS